jgi:hypothetical protein
LGPENFWASLALIHLQRPMVRKRWGKWIEWRCLQAAILES